MASPLVSANWLLEHLSNRGIRIIDTRFKLGDMSFGRNCYLAGHIPGAVFVDLEHDLHSPVRPDRVGGRHPMPDPAVLAVVLSALGVGSGDHVIVYDDPSTGMGFYAPHLWWMLRYLGHDNVSVLDGGLPAWIAAGGALQTEQPTHPAASFGVRLRPGMIVDADYVLHRHPETALIDSRAGERFRGEAEPLDWKAGHIPGAVNKNWAEGLGAAGLWKSSADQAQRFETVSGAPEIIVYCGSGVSAGGNLLALELAGISGAKLYPGSWSDWIIDPSRPVATGE